MKTVPGGTGQRGRAVTRRVFWAGVLALLLLSGPGAAAGSQVLPTGNWVGVESAAQGVGTIPAFVWTLIDFPGVGAIAAPLYTVQFLPDVTVDIGADCNRAGGTWTGGDGMLSITVTTSTRAYCPPPSISEPYLAALNGVTGYTLLGTTLVLHGAAGDMTFSL
jgi:heat shock protein HslJ